MGYSGLHRVTRGYKGFRGLQGVTRVYRRLQGVYKGLQKVTGG